MSCSIALRRSPKPGALTATEVNVPRILLTTRVDSASPSTSSATMSSGLPACTTFSSSGSRSATARDLALVDQDVGVLEDGLHALGVGDEVRRDVALVELHALGELELEAHRVGLLDGDDAVLADLVERLGDELADRAGPARRWSRRGRSRPCPSTSRAISSSLADDGLDGLVDAALERHRARAGGDVAQALADHRLGQHGRGGGAVAGDVVGLGGDLLGELGAEVLVRVLELDLTAMVTPSLVIVGAPHFLSMTTLRPRGPSVTLTASARCVDAALERARARPRRTPGSCAMWSMSFRTAVAGGPDGRQRPERPGLGPGRPGRMSGRCGVVYFSMTASTSRAERTRYSSPLYLTSVPPYLL